MSCSNLALGIAMVVGIAAGGLWGRPGFEPSSTLRSENAAPEPLGERDLAVHRAGGGRSAARSLEVEARVAGQPARGVVIQVLRFERVDGAPQGHWVAASRAVSDANGLAVFRAPASRHLVIAILARPLSKEVDVAQGTASDRVLLESAGSTSLTGIILDAESKRTLGGVESSWRPALLAAAPEAALIKTTADSFGRSSLDVELDSRGTLEATSAGYSKATAPADNPPITLSLEPASVAQGVVIDANGAEVGGDAVRSEPSDGSAVMSSSNGSFML